VADIIRCLNEAHGEAWTTYHGDCVDVVRQLPDRSIDFSVYSPPFSGLYIYNDSECDLGNSADDEEFLTHYQYLADELFRVMRPGRIVAVHCKDLVFYRNQRGTAGLRDFPGMLIRAHERSGFTFHSRVTIWRCPVREMTKTKSHGLLYKQLRADSSFSRQGLPEYILAFRKWAQTEDELADVLPVTKTRGDFPLPWWQETASPVWMNTRETDVLNGRGDPTDERHICPMPLDLTTRATMLWSSPGDVVLSPFMGIGSEGFVALKQRRRFVGVELKETYWRQASRHLSNAESGAVDLFDELAAAE
jgi:DNA modification methylase